MTLDLYLNDKKLSSWKGQGMMLLDAGIALLFVSIIERFKEMLALKFCHLWFNAIR